MIKKWLLLFIILLCCILTTMCANEAVTEVTYYGKSLHWESTMNFDENDKYLINVKYIGAKDDLPLNVTLYAEYLSGNSSGGNFEYTGLINDKFGGFTFETDYDKAIYGTVSKCKDKDKLKVIIKWNNTEETIELSKISNEN